ncbi:ammonium transporter [Brevundimonas sp. GCM10030266]|uniref:ammonium transporter n=1 Tax=Brevundimonas sp. GCM10030266 TaxID=3273386 RepID=UPI0036212AFA
MEKDLIPSLMWAGGLIALALAASLARQMGYLDSDGVNRIVMGAIGLMLVWLGNRMPKAFVPSAQARKANRVGGWSMVISGLIYAGFWAFAPVDAAVWGGCAAVAAGIAVTMGYCLHLRTGGEPA